MGGGTGGLLYSLRPPAGTTGILPGSPGPNYAPAFNRYNSRGDVISQSSASGAVTWAASYRADGKRTSETGSNRDRQRANTKEEDPTGLLNEGFRYRDTETGTFISRDPAGFVDGPNVYTYVQQNPWTSFDPNGLALVSAYSGSEYGLVHSDPKRPRDVLSWTGDGSSPIKDFSTKLDSPGPDLMLNKVACHVDTLSLGVQTAYLREEQARRQQFLSEGMAPIYVQERIIEDDMYWKEQRSANGTYNVVNSDRTFGKFVEFAWDNTAGSAGRLLTGKGDLWDAANLVPLGFLGRVGKTFERVIPRAGLVTGSGGLDIASAQFVRNVAKGERFSDLVTELKVLQFQGVEANLVRMKGGAQRIYTGGFDGTNWDAIADQIHSVRLHTHPNITGPSPADISALKSLNQRYGSIWEWGDATQIKLYDQAGKIRRNLDIN
jgi:RHS repeat-associated protein